MAEQVNAPVAPQHQPRMQIPVNIRQNVVVNPYKSTMGNFGAGGSLTRIQGSQALDTVVPVDEEATVEIHVPGQGENPYSLISTLAVAMENENNGYQLSAYVCSIIGVYVPNIIQLVVEVFRDLGMRAIEVGSDADREENGLALQNSIPGPTAMVYFGQAVLLLYKNVQAASYINFMTRRITALSAVAGLAEAGETRIAIMLQTNRAELVSRVLGSCFTLRKVLLETILNAAMGTSRFATFCTYLAGILEHTEMASLSFIYETLLLTRSPVISVAQLRQERHNLRKAFEAVNNTDHPKYFKLMRPPHETRVIERINFPTFIAVAKRIKAGQTTTASQFATTRGDNDLFVESLVQMHQNYLDTLNPVALSDVEYFFDRDPANIIDPKTSLRET